MGGDVAEWQLEHLRGSWLWLVNGTKGKTKSKDGGSGSLHELDHEYCIEGYMDC